MGNSASKAARQYPKTKPSWAGARTSEMPAQTIAKGQPTAIPKASESRTEAIESDAKDPHLAANLIQLGAVKVDHHMRTFRPASARIEQAFKRRLESEQDASSSRTSHNHLLSSALADFLEARKGVTSREELAKLTKQFDVDASRLEGLARFISSPTVDPRSVKRVVTDDGVEQITMKAMWVDPPVGLQQLWPRPRSKYDP